MLAISMGRLNVLAFVVALVCSALLCLTVRAADSPGRPGESIEQLSFAAIAGSRTTQAAIVPLDVGPIACRKAQATLQARAVQPPAALTPPAAAAPKWETRWVCQGRYCVPMRVRVQ